VDKARNQYPDFSELEKAFYADGYKLASTYYIADDLPESLNRAMIEFYKILNSFIDIFLEKASEEGSPAECKKGCSYCCYQSVFAQTHEINFLKDWMIRNLGDQDLEIVRKKAAEKRQRINSMSTDHKLVHKEACSLLQDNICIAYDVRPVACRIYLSKSIESCEYEFQNPEDKSIFPQLFELTMRLGRKLNEGFTDALKEKGYELEEYTLEEGLFESKKETDDEGGAR
jgi:Fe-S-cluster containining protein